MSENDLGKPSGRNVDSRIVSGFGDEWSRFDQATLTQVEWRSLFDQYFHLVDWDELPTGAQAFDAGCGSGRWAVGVAPKVETLHLIDASADALDVARRNLAGRDNCIFHCTSVDAVAIAPESMDFGYSLGVLHHLPDPPGGLRSCVSRLKPGAPFLVYMYYAFDNRPRWFRILWRLSDVIRQTVSRLPLLLRYGVSQTLAATVYWPLAKAAALGERSGFRVDAWPLSFYRHRSFYTMRTDALDRFGTRLEHRMTRAELTQMLTAAGLERIRFSEEPPYWCAIGYRAMREIDGEEAR